MRHGKGHKADEKLGTSVTPGEEESSDCLSVEKQRIRGSYQCMWKGGQWGVKTKPDPSQWCPVTGQEVIGSK